MFFFFSLIPLVLASLSTANIANVGQSAQNVKINDTIPMLANGEPRDRHLLLSLVANITMPTSMKITITNCTKVAIVIHIGVMYVFFGLAAVKMATAVINVCNRKKMPSVKMKLDNVITRIPC